jgi:hypothetical protein
MKHVCELLCHDAQIMLERLQIAESVHSMHSFEYETRWNIHISLYIYMIICLKLHVYLPIVTKKLQECICKIKSVLCRKEAISIKGQIWRQKFLWYMLLYSNRFQAWTCVGQSKIKWHQNFDGKKSLLKIENKCKYINLLSNTQKNELYYVLLLNITQFFM